MRPVVFRISNIVFGLSDSNTFDFFISTEYVFTILPFLSQDILLSEGIKSNLPVPFDESPSLDSILSKQS